MGGVVLEDAHAHNFVEMCRPGGRALDGYFIYGHYLGPQKAAV